MIPGLLKEPFIQETESLMDTYAKLQELDQRMDRLEEGFAAIRVQIIQLNERIDKHLGGDEPEGGAVMAESPLPEGGAGGDSVAVAFDPETTEKEAAEQVAKNIMGDEGVL